MVYYFNFINRHYGGYRFLVCTEPGVAGSDLVGPNPFWSDPDSDFMTGSGFEPTKGVYCLKKSYIIKY